MRSKSILHRRRRSRSGSMMGMVALVGAILLAVCMCGFVISILFTSQHRTEAQADDLVLSMSLQLNRHNWVGQMNNLVESARELVFTSRSVSDEVLQEYPRLSALASRLLEESREAAEFVDKERNHLGFEICYDTQRQAAEFNARRPAPPLFNLPWLKTEALEVRGVELGSVRNVQSSARLPEAIPDLREYDVRRHLANKESNLYFAGDNVALPPPDEDLNFSLSSLPAAVEGVVPSARLTTVDVFEPIGVIFEDGKNYNSSLKRLPSAVRLTASMNVRRSSDETIKPDSVKIQVAGTTRGSGSELP
ncbi:MAG: hypothetical protein U0103_14620 [Candidatus Obscuribacterales bacterium]